MLTNLNGDINALKPTIDMCATNVEHLFKKYEAAGFLYPDKKELLRPHFYQIKENWKTLANSEKRLLWICSASAQTPKPHFASITIWKPSNYGAFAQHLISTGNPYLSLKVMLEVQNTFGGQATEMEIRSSQNWFRPNNRYAYRIFASMYDKLGADRAALIPHEYVHLPVAGLREPGSCAFRAEEVEGIDPELIQFVKNQYGGVFLRAEELDQSDIRLRRIGRCFRQHGLELSRKIFKLRELSTGKIRACLVANRAPLGMNFSFLENRAYYILDRQLNADRRTTVLSAMHQAAYTVYRDIPIGVVPIVTDQQTAQLLTNQGATKVRQYIQSIWMREGFRQWYDHIDSFLKRIQRRTQA